MIFNQPLSFAPFFLRESPRRQSSRSGWEKNPVGRYIKIFWGRPKNSTIWWHREQDGQPVFTFPPVKTGPPRHLRQQVDIVRDPVQVPAHIHEDLHRRTVLPVLQPLLQQPTNPLREDLRPHPKNSLFRLRGTAASDPPRVETTPSSSKTRCSSSPESPPLREMYSRIRDTARNPL